MSSAPPGLAADRARAALREDQGWGWRSKGVLGGRGREMFPLLSGQAVNSPSGSRVCLGHCCSWVRLRFPGVPGETVSRWQTGDPPPAAFLLSPVPSGRQPRGRCGPRRVRGASCLSPHSVHVGPHPSPSVLLSFSQPLSLPNSGRPAGFIQN